MNKNLKSLRYIAASLFLILAIIEVFPLRYLSFENLLLGIGFLLCCLALMKEQYLFISIGGIILTVIHVLFFISAKDGLERLVYLHGFKHYVVREYARHLFSITWAVLLSVAGLKRNSAKLLCYIAAAVRFLVWVFDIYYDFSSIVTTIPVVAATVLVGLVLSDKYKNESFSTSATVTTTPSGTPVVNAELSTVDSIKQYKELLDQGVLTEEEFAEKKKQILGL